MKTVICIARRLKSSLQKLYGHHYGFPLRHEALPFYVHFFIPLSSTILLLDYTNNMTGILQETENAYPSRAPLLLIFFIFSVWCFSFVFVLCLVPNVVSVSGDCSFVIFPPGFSSVYIVVFYIIYNSSAYLRNIIFLCIKKILVRSQYIYLPGFNGNMTFFYFSCQHSMTCRV